MNTLEIVKLTGDKATDPAKSLYLMDVAKACHFIDKTGRVDPASLSANPVRAHKVLLSMIENNTATVLVAVQDAAYQGSIVLEYNDEKYPDDIYMGALFTRGDAPYKTALKLIRAAVEEATAKGKIAITITEGPTKKDLHRADTRLGFQASGHVTPCGQRVFKANAGQVWERLSTRHNATVPTGEGREAS